MIKSKIGFKNNKPYISIDGKPYSPLAYTTYFEERGEYSDFIRSGYRMFFVNVSFTDLPINNVTGFSPFMTGVHCYNSDGCVVYCGEGFLGIHSIHEGKTKISLPEKYTVRPLLGADIPECETDELLLDMKKHDTAVFELI